MPIRMIVMLCLMLLAARAGMAADAPPNIVLILGDDQAWFDFGFLGGETIDTPHLDQLASESAVFPNGYVSASLCMPSLASMITGRHAHEHQSGIGLHGIRPGPRVVEAQYERYPSIPKRLQEAGYSSLQTGKWWDLGFETGGFTEGMTLPRGVPGSKFLHRADQAGPPQVANLEKGILFLGGGEGLRIGREGMQPIAEFLQRQNDNPFFLWYAPMMPHTPHTPPQRLYDKYQSPDRTESQILYMAMCEWFDETVGELLDLLESSGKRENTLVFFIVDNGFIPLPDRPGVLDPRSKTSPYDAGVRTPILVNWPGRIAPARHETLAHAIDLLPTSLAAAGLEIPEDLPGVNLLDVCDGKPVEREIVFGGNFRHKTENPQTPDDTVDARWCVAAPWKLILFRNREPELYRLDEDPRETKSLAKDHPDRVEELRARIDAWWSPRLN